jgi:hypothetical protein
MLNKQRKGGSTMFYKRLTLAFFAVCFSITAFLIQPAFANEGVVLGNTPRRIIFNYLKFLVEVGALEEFQFTSGILEDKAPDDGLISIKNNKVLNDILNEIDFEYTSEYWTREMIIGSVNEALQGKGYDLNGLGSQVVSFIQASPLLRTSIEEMEFFLEIDLDQRVSVSANLVYPVVNNIRYLGNTQAAWSVPEIEMSMMELLQMNQINSYISGVADGNIANGFSKAIDLAYSVEMKKYLGGDVDVNNPEHLSALLYFGQLQDTLIKLFPVELIKMGYGKILAQVEAIENDWFTRADKKGRIIDSKPDISDATVSKYISTRLDLATIFQAKLNEVDYYGRQLSITDSYEAGLINSWVDAVFDKMREKNYNPVSQSFTGSYTLAQATASIENFIDIAKDLKPAMEAVYGSLPITDKGRAGEHARNLVNIYSNLALTLQENGVATDKKDAVEKVSKLLPGVSNGAALLNKFKELYAAAGVSKSDSYFKTEQDGQMAYAGFLTVAVSMLDYDNYFGIGNESFEDIFGSDGELVKMINTGLEMGLVDKVKEYLGESGDLSMDEGYIAGIYTFWNQVLYAAVENLGEENGKDYVWQQLDARTELRQALQDVGIYEANNARTAGILGAFERGLDGSLSNLQSSLDEVINLINSQGIDRGNYQQKLSDGVLDNLSDPKFYLYPRSVDESNEWNWSDLYAGGGTASLDLTTDEIAVIGDSSPDFSTTSAPLAPFGF